MVVRGRSSVVRRPPSNLEPEPRVADLNLVAGTQSLRAADSDAVHVDAVRGALVTYDIRSVLDANRGVAAGDRRIVVKRNRIGRLATQRHRRAVHVERKDGAGVDADRA